MANFLDNALGIHRERLQDTAGDVCTYVRARFKIQNVRCVTGQSDFAVANNELEGFSDIKTIDFLVRIEDLQIGGEAIEPQRGDRVEYRGEVFDIVPSIYGTMWRWSDSRKVWYRLHTERRSVQSN